MKRDLLNSASVFGRLLKTFFSSQTTNIRSALEALARTRYTNRLTLHFIFCAIIYAVSSARYLLRT